VVIDVGRIAALKSNVGIEQRKKWRKPLSLHPLKKYPPKGMESMVTESREMLQTRFIKHREPTENPSPIVMGKILLRFFLVASMLEIR